jgi:hypothetical protein
LKFFKASLIYAQSWKTPKSCRLAAFCKVFGFGANIQTGNFSFRTESHKLLRPMSGEINQVACGSLKTRAPDINDLGVIHA